MAQPFVGANEPPLRSGSSLHSAFAAADGGERGCCPESNAWPAACGGEPCVRPQPSRRRAGCAPCSGPAEGSLPPAPVRGVAVNSPFGQEENMKRFRILAAVWLIAGLVGLPVFGLGLLRMASTGHLAVPIAALRLPELEKAGSDYKPTLEEYRIACITVKRQMDDMSSIVATHLFFFGPLIILCFISFWILRSAQRRTVPNKASEAISEPAPGAASSSSQG